MTPEDYDEAVALARGWQKGAGYPRPISRSLMARLNVRVGVYFACLTNGELDYIGSAVRPDTSHGLMERIRGHPRSRRARWGRFWVLPLRNDTPESIVRAIEGQLIDMFSPPENRRRHSSILIPTPQQADVEDRPR